MKSDFEVARNRSIGSRGEFVVHYLSRFGHSENPHSDHIVNGVRVAVKQEVIKPDDVAIFYFERDYSKTEHMTKVTDILIDKYGELNQYPEGMLDEWSNLLIELV